MFGKLIFSSSDDWQDDLCCSSLISSTTAPVDRRGTSLNFLPIGFLPFLRYYIDVTAILDWLPVDDYAFSLQAADGMTDEWREKQLFQMGIIFQSMFSAWSTAIGEWVVKIFFLYNLLIIVKHIIRLGISSVKLTIKL